MKIKIREKLFEIIFEADTRAGKLFDIAILIAILMSILTVMAESVPLLRKSYPQGFFYLEWAFTLIFTLEYFLRVYSANKRCRYILSFFGIIDLLAILPAYLGFFLAGGHSLIIIRAIRLLRVFRIFKVNRYLKAAEVLKSALIASREKISVFLFSVLMVVILIGTVMYLIEGEANGFTSIPKSIYWAIVTLTTVGYGDITPQTAPGQFLSAILMITGYAIIAVPTGIISLEIARSEVKKSSTQVCPECMKEGHEPDAVHCKFCGARL
ncbi:MAG: ion transporter [Bacteroidales bacterium]|nr:ion transporter [Bacteroidales bacterium]